MSLEICWHSFSVTTAELPSLQSLLMRYHHILHIAIRKDSIRSAAVTRDSGASDDAFRVFACFGAAPSCSCSPRRAFSFIH